MEKIKHLKVAGANVKVIEDDVFDALPRYAHFFNTKVFTPWFQLEGMFQLMITPQGIERVTIQLKDTPTKVYALGGVFIKGAPTKCFRIKY